MCEDHRDFAICLIRKAFSEGHTQPRVIVRHNCRAYAADTGITIKSLHWLFMMKYLDFDSLMRTASTGDISPCQTGAGRVAYNTIEACIRPGNNIRSLSSGARSLLDSDPLLGSGFFG
jgi:hypothetical protein